MANKATTPYSQKLGMRFGIFIYSSYVGSRVDLFSKFCYQKVLLSIKTWVFTLFPENHVILALFPAGDSLYPKNGSIKNLTNASEIRVISRINKHCVFFKSRVFFKFPQGRFLPTPIGDPLEI